MDVTRILAEEPGALQPTDITEEALAELRRSRVEEIVLLGRRGPAEAAFSPPEIKEIGALEHADLIVAPAEVALDEASRHWLQQAAPAARKNVDYLTEASTRPPKGAPRRVVVRFLVSPVELAGDAEGRLRAVRLERNELVPDASGTPRPRGTGRFEELAVELLFKAVGYHGQPLPGVPFDERRGVLPNVEGRVIDPASGAPVPGLYAVGWAKRGPSGLIGTNGPDSEATVAKMLEDARAGGAMDHDETAKRPEAMVELLRARGVDAVSFADWQRLDRDEVERGGARGKCRLKHTSVESMMDAVRRLRPS
jgi:ferredoxin--NADP+ reductase